MVNFVSVTVTAFAALAATALSQFVVVPPVVAKSESAAEKPPLAVTVVASAPVLALIAAHSVGLTASVTVIPIASV